MKKNHNIRRFICALIAAGMLTSAASTGVFADSPSNNHPGNSQTQGTPGFDQGNNANTGHGQDGTGNGSLTGEDSEPRTPSPTKMMTTMMTTIVTTTTTMTTKMTV